MAHRTVAAVWGGAMTEPELDAMLQQYPGWIAIERLVETIRQERDVIAHIQQTLRQWYDGSTLRQRPGESDEEYCARCLALRNTTVSQIMRPRGETPL